MLEGDVAHEATDDIPVDPDYILLAEVDLHSPAEDILHHSWREGRHVTVSIVILSSSPTFPTVLSRCPRLMRSEAKKPSPWHCIAQYRTKRDTPSGQTFNDERVYEPLLRVLWSLICIIALVRHDCGSPWMEKRGE